MGLHPLVSFVARPVKHVRLATALLKASALMRSKSQARILFGLTNKNFVAWLDEDAQRHMLMRQSLQLTHGPPGGKPSCSTSARL